MARWTIIGDVGTDIQPVVPFEPQRKRLWRAIRWPFFGLCTILLIAWMSLPTLDGPHRRQFANEAVSVAKLRTINRRQALYSAAHPDQGFACELSRLKSTERAEETHYDPEEFLVSGTQSGYRFVVLNCESDHYAVAAVPIEPGRSGFRAFCTDDSGLLWYDKDGSAQDCLALHQPLE